MYGGGKCDKGQRCRGCGRRGYLHDEARDEDEEQLHRLVKSAEEVDTVAASTSEITDVVIDVEEHIHPKWRRRK